MYLANAILHFACNTKIETSLAQMAPHNSLSQLGFGAQFEGRAPTNAECGDGHLHHNNDVIMGATASQKPPASRPSTQSFTQALTKENTKAPRHWPLCGEFTGDQWTPPHKWPVTRKMLPFDDVIMIRCKFIQSYIIGAGNIRHNMYIMLYMMAIAKTTN